MTQDQATLLADTRLSREARLMGLYVSTLGEGEHQVSHDEFRILLGRGAQGLPKDQTIAGYTQELELLAGLCRREGGRGSPYYSFPHPPGDGRRESLPSPESSPLPGGEGKQTVSHPLRGGQTPPSSSYPSPPPPPDAREGEVTLSPEVEATIEASAETLVGCRDSLLDYLAVRVEPRYRVAYVQRVVTSLQGADEWMWKDRSGRTLTDGRTKVLAAAFNELAAGDEVGKHFQEAPGGYGNLRSKVRYLVASSLGVERDSARNGTTNTPTPAKPRGMFPESKRSTTDGAT